MKLRKLFAATLAIALAAVTIPTTPAKADIVHSQSAWINTNVYDIELPTTALQKFYIDPNGLSYIAENGKQGIPTVSKGAIVSSKTPMKAVNVGSKPVLMKTEAYIVDSANIISIETSANDALTNTDTAPAIFLQAVATQITNATGVVSTGSMSAGTAWNDGSQKTLAVSVASGSSMVTTTDIALGEAVYEVSTKAGIDYDDDDARFNPDNYIYDMTTSGGAIEIKLDGACSYQNADWSDYTGANANATLDLDLVFKFYKDDAAAAKDLYESKAFSYDKSTRTVTWTSEDITDIVSINMTNVNGTFDAMTGYPAVYAAATKNIAAKTVVIDSAYCSFYSGTVAATITYVEKGATKTTTVNFVMS